MKDELELPILLLLLFCELLSVSLLTFDNDEITKTANDLFFTNYDITRFALFLKVFFINNLKGVYYSIAAYRRSVFIRTFEACSSKELGYNIVTKIILEIVHHLILDHLQT